MHDRGIPDRGSVRQPTFFRDGPKSLLEFFAAGALLASSVTTERVHPHVGEVGAFQSRSTSSSYSERSSDVVIRQDSLSRKNGRCVRR